MLQIGLHDLHIGQRLELPIAATMIQMAVRMHHQQGQLRRAIARQQTHHGLRERHLLRIGHITGIDQQRTM